MLSYARLNILIAVATLAIAACGGGSSGGGGEPPPRIDYTYRIPTDIGDGWQLADLASEGFDTQQIAVLMDQIVNEDYPGIDSIAIVRNENLLLYWSANRELTNFDAWIGNTNRERHILHSTSKSFTSALIGIAIDKGFIASTDVKFYDLFNYAGYDNWDPRKAEMTLEDALTMRLGLTWDEWSLSYTNPNNDLVFLENNNLDWSKALLDLPMSRNPGTTFTYNTAATIAIGKALQNATGMPMAQFADANLFLPMQITNAVWARSPTNLPIGGSGLFLETRDLIKFGQLYLNGGSWQGQQLISADWVAASVIRHVDLSAILTFSDGYGYQWWLDQFNYKGQQVEAWITSGYGGQFIFAIPSLDLVVAFTGHNYENNTGIASLYTIMGSGILQAID